jgi:hypothetical protein
MNPSAYPGALGELQFVDAYLQGALRKPQVVADSLLRSLVLSGQNDRLILSGLLAEQLAEACRRLTGVYLALSDRRYPVARTLAGALPGLEQWLAFIQAAGTFTPEQMLRELGLGDDALGSAMTLRAQPGLASVTDLVAAAEMGSAMLLMPNGRLSEECWFAGPTPGGDHVAASLGTEEHDAAALADLTADLCSIARGFLGSYLDARRVPYTHP